MDTDERTRAEIDKTNLQNDLLTAVKECQKKYGTRIELATELDTLVAHVCYCFESILSHGLKKQLTSINFVEKPTYWHCVSNILSHHERDRYNSLYKVKSNVGKGRAWLRSALNERSLERYLNTLICNDELLGIYYEREAFLCDQERSYILLSAAAGLDPILFAISVDREDLNRKFDNINDTFHNEQIICTIPVDVMKVSNLRKKLQSKVIDFDSDAEYDGNYDEINAGMTTVSDISPMIEVPEDSSKIIISDNMSLSSDSGDKVSTGLRPIGNEAVDELIPVLSDITEVDETVLFPYCPKYALTQKDYIRFECLFLPDKGAFFVNYVITSAFIGTGLELIRFPELFLYAIRVALSRSRAETISARKLVLWEFAFGVHYAWMLLIFALTVVYSVSCPLITLFGLVYMLMKHFVDRYNIYFAYGPSKIKQQIHATAINFVIASVVLLQAVFLILAIIRMGFEQIAIYAAIGFGITIAYAFAQCFLRWCESWGPIHYQGARSRSAQSPRKRENQAQYQYVPEVLKRCSLSRREETNGRASSQLGPRYTCTSPEAVETQIEINSLVNLNEKDTTILYQNYNGEVLAT